MTVVRILYRGSLSSCNYACNYCPFAKTKNTADELRTDKLQLQRFVKWIHSQDAHRQFGILMTPWGEAIIHRYYREALVQLSHLPNIQRVAIQTNLSGHLSELSDANTDRLAIWATWHPGETPLERFLQKCNQLLRFGIRFSVGVVGLKEHFDHIEQLRNNLDPSVYLWINAFKRTDEYYSPADIDRLTSIDPYFQWNLHRYPSFERSCNAGSTAITVNGDGDVRRCHFVDQVIGNIYQDNIYDHLAPRDCPNQTCGCHIGYVHLPHLQLEQLYGDNLLERIPATWPEIDPQMQFPHQVISNSPQEPTRLYSIQSC